MRREDGVDVLGSVLAALRLVLFLRFWLGAGVSAACVFFKALELHGEQGFPAFGILREPVVPQGVCAGGPIESMERRVPTRCPAQNLLPVLGVRVHEFKSIAESQ